MTPYSNCLFQKFYSQVELLDKCIKFGCEINDAAFRPFKKTIKVIHDSKNI